MSSSVKRSKRKLISSDDENLEVRRINLSPLKIKRCNLELNSLEKNLDFDTFADEYCNEPSDDIYNKYNRRVMIRKMQFLFSLKPELELKGKVNYPPPVMMKKRNKKLAKYLDSFVFLEDDLEFSREQYEFYLNEQIEMINSIQQFEAEHGKIEAPMPTPIQYKSFHDPIPKVNFTDTLMNEMKYISKIMIDMRKHKVIICRKVAKSIQKYWESRDLVEGKSGKQEEKRIKKLAKDTANEVRKQWKLVEAIITSKKKMVADLEAQKAGKLHLFAIIEQSAQVLKDQQQDMLLNELEGSDEERSQENSNPDEEVSGSLLDDDELSEISSENSFSSEEHLGDDQGLEQLIGDMDFENSKYNANNLEMSDVVEDDRDQRLNDDLGEVNDQMDADAIVISTQELSSNIIDADNTAVTDYDVNEKTNTDADSILNIKEANDVKLDMHTPVTPIPPLLKHTLRSYQHTGLDWLVGLYNKGLNGILADEMGLGKTIQTISLLAYLAFYKGNWGPHLIVVPTSVILNWEYEFKKWCPAFKILTYFGNQKERKEKRLGWSKENSFHICITSYQLVLSDQNNFKRKFWQYLILDEAHNIKNFRSQRWQTLLTFNSVRRLLLTGTPLQNNLLELWSLLYFLMPRGSVSSSEIMPTGFASQKEFQEWFQNPVDKIIEKNSEHDKETKDTILKLHTVLRPFLLRRLKKDVEKEMPSKIEHVVSCRLSRRQKYLYDDFMSRAKTKEDLSSGNFMSILNCLMQLRKVCNHPDLFEVRSIITSFAMGGSVFKKSLTASEKFTQLLLNTTKFNEISIFEKYKFLKSFGLILNIENFIYQNQMEALDCEELIEERIKMIENDENVSNFFESANIEVDLSDKISYEKVYENRKKLRELNKWKKIKLLNRFRLNYFKFNMNFGSNLINFLNIEKQKNFSCFNVDDTAIYKNLEHRVSEFEYMIKKFNVPTRKVVVMNNKNFLLDKKFRLDLEKLKKPKDIFHPFNLRLGFAFPDKYLLQYDCGKLQTLDKLLRDLKVGGHRALIFTQMTKMLDVLESFLNMHGHIYLRLDGSTQVQQRQILMDRFNNDKRILCFILSTRSGGVGMNLIGADSVIFYDSDWNPAMDAQAQDRAHRIGQTRDVHIYRFITSHTIEENMLKKANKKRVLDNIVIQEGEFNTDFFRKMHWKDWLGEEDDEEAGDDNVESENIGSIKNLEEALAMAEDQEDVVAMKNARKELNIIDLEDFKENEEGSFGSQQKQLQESNNPENSEDEKESHGVEKYMFKLVLNDWGFDEEIKLKEFFI